VFFNNGKHPGLELVKLTAELVDHHFRGQG